MECKEIEHVLSAYLENELPAEQREQVQSHLASCSRCRELKSALEHLFDTMPDLEEDVPFFLRNRLYTIAEQAETRRPAPFVFPKWVAAGIGSIVVMFNLLYFTNIFPPANRRMHIFVSNVQRVWVQTEGWLERIRESKDLLISSIFSKKASPDAEETATPKKGEVKIETGGEHGK